MVVLSLLLVRGECVCVMLCCEVDEAVISEVAGILVKGGEREGAAVEATSNGSQQQVGRNILPRQHASKKNARISIERKGEFPTFN